MSLDASDPLVTDTDTGTGTITDNDSASVTVADVTEIEGTGLSFTVTLVDGSYFDLTGGLGLKVHEEFTIDIDDPATGKPNVNIHLQADNGSEARGKLGLGGLWEPPHVALRAGRSLERVVDSFRLTRLIDPGTKGTARNPRTRAGHPPERRPAGTFRGMVQNRVTTRSGTAQAVRFCRECAAKHRRACALPLEN